MDANTLQIIFMGITSIATVSAALFAYGIGKRQNEINEQALHLSDFAEIFFMPQQVTYKKVNSEETHIGWNLLVKNASSYPIYINKYKVNQNEVTVGGSVVPTYSDNWYVIQIPQDITEFDVVVEFEDHRGKKYQTEGKGIFTGTWWSINSVRRTELN